MPYRSFDRLLIIIRRPHKVASALNDGRTLLPSNRRDGNGLGSVKICEVAFGGKYNSINKYVFTTMYVLESRIVFANHNTQIIMEKLAKRITFGGVTFVV